MIRHFLLAYFFLFLQFSQAQNPPLTAINNSKEITSIQSSKIGYFIESSPLSIDQALEHEWSITEGNKIFSSQPHPIWFAFKLEKATNRSFQGYVFELANAHIGQYDIYFREGDETLATFRQGDNFVFGKREVQHNYFIHNIPITKGDIIDVYIRVDQGGQEISMPISISQRPFFVKQTIHTKIFHGLIIGIFLITSVVTFFLYCIYKERYFLYEVILSVASIFYILAEEGYGLMLFWQNTPSFNGTSRPLFIAIVIIFSTLFTEDFLSLKKIDRLTPKLTRGLILLLIAFMVFAHPIDIFEIRTRENIGLIISIFLSLIVFQCTYILFLSLRSWIKEKNFDALIILILFLVTGFSIIIRFLAFQGIGLNSPIVAHTGFITRGIHIPLIGGFLIYKALSSYRKNQEVQISLLEEKNKRTREVIESVDTERQRISMALHDSAGSIVTALKANLEMITENAPSLKENINYNNSIELSNQLQSEIRDISNDILPSSITKIGIEAEIKSILRRIEKTYDITTSFETNSNNEPIEEKFVRHLYYIVREALDNIVKYAEAKNILVQFYIFEDDINILIEDDGKGFNVTSARNGTGSGLNNMATRINWLNGTIDIYSKKGTSISINIPRT